MKSFKPLILAMSMVISVPASAGVVMGGTRVIYPQSAREVAFTVANKESATPYLIQSWIENDTVKNQSDTPFIITPPLFRLDPEQTNTLRIQYTGAPLPADRESVFWLNIKVISPKPKASTNELQINIKSKFKLFYRPAALTEGAGEAWNKLTFARTSQGIKATNPTPYYVSFYKLTVDGKNIADPGMIAPGSSREWPAATPGTVSWSAINDFGGITASHSQNL